MSEEGTTLRSRFRLGFLHPYLSLAYRLGHPRRAGQTAREEGVRTEEKPVEEEVAGQQVAEEAEGRGLSGLLSGER